ncbi:RNA-binding protein [Nibricoccus aquaticus]|uniref:RNA-binding protein n=1 Tax=Nibricoccus aquaticus TaxID=2576891 RepID=A0A290Q6W8_9BACT|nr:RNA-binding protein [Nibricoccus aquaticus]ATC64389.1 RNA-binding protein [Nibricoccus aquaticus]
MTSKLYVGNLPFNTTAQELQDLFTDAGAVSAVDLIFDKFTGRSRGFAFVNMASPEDAQRVIEKFHGFDMAGRALTVNEARPREERPREFAGGDSRENSGFGGGGGRSSSRNERNFR